MGEVKSNSVSMFIRGSLKLQPSINFEVKMLREVPTGRGLDRTVTCEFRAGKLKKTTLFHPTMTHNILMYLFGEFWNPAYSIEEIKLNSHLCKLERIEELVSVLQSKEVADPRHIVMRVFMPEEIGVAWMLTELARYINYILQLTWWEHFLFPVWSLWPQLWRIFSDPR